MDRKYQKFEIHMTLENDGYRLWKNASDEAICVLETYKEKRSIFFSVWNLLPSKELASLGKGEYHLLLLGAKEGELLYKDFGSVQVGGNGEGRLFQKFDGPELSDYTHCLLTAVCEGGEEPDIIYRGETPFFPCSPKESVWKARMDQCLSKESTDVFSAEIDETGAKWYRVIDGKELPETLKPAEQNIKIYHHYILGVCGDTYYVGIPGRFLKKEQPCREEGVFLLWQPLRGGEKFFDRCENMTSRQQEEIFGYWIAGIEMKDGTLKPL